MFQHVSILGMGAAIMLALPAPTATDAQFALTTSGALRITATGEAEYGALPATSEVPAAFSISLGAQGESGALVLMQRVGTVPLAGRYGVSEWSGHGGADFSAIFVAGSPAEPIGVFRGESGTVTITATRPGRIEGRFRIEARGFLASAPDDENVKVTLSGTFVARGNHTVATVQQVAPAVPL
jgi:hypothetical protein